MSVPFYLVYISLQWLARMTGFSYEEINVVIWYLGVPLVYSILLDKIIRRPVFTPTLVTVATVLYFSLPNPSLFADRLFHGSVRFLESFSGIGVGYDAASVLICVWFPFIVFLILFTMAFPRWCKRHLPSLRSCVPWLKRA